VELLVIGSPAGTIGGQLTGLFGVRRHCAGTGTLALRERYSWGNYVNPNVKMDARMEQSVYSGRVLDLETKQQL
jgi:hypothetical protein